MKLKIMLAALVALACAPPAMAQVVVQASDNVTGVTGSVQVTTKEGRRAKVPVYVPVNPDGTVISGGGGSSGGTVGIIGANGGPQVMTGAPSSGVPLPSDVGLTVRSINHVFNGSGFNLQFGDTNGTYAVGNVAAGTADVGNPVKVGGVYRATSPTLADGQRTDLQSDVRGNLEVSLFGANSTNGVGSAASVTAGAITNASFAGLYANTVGRLVSGSSNYAITGNLSGHQYVVQALESSTTSGVAPVATTAVAGGQVLKASAANLYGLNVVSGASAGYVLVTNTTTVPADGAVTPLKCYALAANSSLDLNLRAAPVYFSTGVSVSFSTTGCFTKTASATAFISGDVK